MSRVCCSARIVSFLSVCTAQKLNLKRSSSFHTDVSEDRTIRDHPIDTAHHPAIIIAVAVLRTRCVHDSLQ